MTAKLNIFAAAPSLMKDWQRAMTTLAAASNFDPSLSELVKLRASQINGCANCLNLHATEARANGETEQRIYLLPAWRERSLLHRSRARRACMDRGADTAFRGKRAHERLRSPESPLH